MGWIRKLFGLGNVPAVDDPSVTFSHDIPTPIDEVISRMMGATTPHVGREEALSVPAVLKGRNLICSVSTLPLVTRGPDRQVSRSGLLEQIDPDVPNVVTLAQTVEDLIFESISWWRVTERYAPSIGEFPAAAIRVDPRVVSLQPPPGVVEQALPSGAHPDGVVWVNGEPVARRNMLRFDSPNPPLLSVGGRAIKRAITIEVAAAMYAEDPRMLDYFAPAEGADPASDDEIQEILDDWRKARQDRTTGYVPAALEYNTVDTPNPADLQLVELMKQASVDIANEMGIDPEDLGVSTTSRTYANAVDRRRDRINDTLAPYMRAITDRLSMNDVTRRGHRVLFDLDDYLKADAKTRWETHAIGLQSEAVSVPEVREAEGLPAVPVERALRRSPRPDPAVAVGGRGEMFTNDENETHVQFDLPQADAEFRVNREKRTISGLLVPWNAVAESGMARWRFAKDSLNWSSEARVKLNRDHDRSQLVGVATRLQSTPDGLDGSFRIARGEEGDKILSFAEDGLLDGFSIEVNFDDANDWVRDPDDELVRMVKRGRLRGVAITGNPAFDDARVTSVAATREDGPMPEEAEDKNEVQESAGQTGPDFSVLDSAVQALADKFNVAANQIGQVSQSPVEQPASVDPTRRPVASLSVNEEPLYRFDGTHGQHDFSTDIIAGAKGDYEALKRAEQWMSTEFAVNQSGTSALNPERQRPDLYVDQLEFVTPIWDSIRKGTIPDNTPFVLPKFAASSGLVNDHTEGTEPTPGALTATSQTITPSPVSGKVEVTREAWDQGGNPQLSTILWRQMTRAYDESLEQAANTMLDGLTVTEITLSVAAVDEALAEEIKSALAALHFVRGGNRFRDLKVEQGLYTALASANDTTGRPLFPILNPSNSDGRTDAFFGSVSVGGLAGVPSWALPGTVVGTPNTPGKSYLYNREDVSGWASAPQRMDFQYRVAYVDVAIWGYKALAATRNDGVRRINYDDGSS